MKSNTFNYSLLAVGVAAVLGISTTANAAKSGSTTTGVEITNKASASYNVSGQTQPVVESNEVKITVSEQVSFSLVAENDDTAAGGKIGDDANIKEAVAPNGFAAFKHTLTNTGNREDTYTITLTGNDPKYDPANSTVSYKIYDAAGVEDTTRAVDNAPYTIANGKSFPLEKGHYIKFTINAKTINNKGGDSQQLTISAESTVLAANPAAPTSSLTNTNNSFTRLPTFGIVKTITNALDLNDDKDTATYQIVVNNDGNTAFSADATDIAITDNLPAGLVLAEPLTATNIGVTGLATKGTIDTSNAGDNGFNITGVNIPTGQSLTITFKVKKGGTGTLVPTTAINHVKVTDDLDDNTATNNTLVDSTDSTVENVAAFYPTDDVDNVNGETPASAGDDSTVPLLTIERALTLTGVTTREIAPTSGTAGQVTHQTVITNNGQDREGDTAGELTFTINDNDGNTPDAVNIVFDTVTITYDADGAGSGAPGQPITISPTLVGGINVYDIKTALPNGIAPTGTVTINYKVSSTNAPFFTPINSTTPTTENTVVTLKPANEGAPASATVTDSTTVRGLLLVKKQAIDADCTGTSVGTFVTTDITGASPGECIIYRIEAQNTSTAALGFNITDLVVSDLLAKFSAEADYVDGSATTTASAGGPYTATNNGTAITTTVDTLAPQGTATMQFKVKIKTAR
ncbi:hypothetical protein [Psychrobacter sp. W2-37-MNA-CIBAN-0211]|uniref:DUF7933 domain-containing protein n=1 Tax=Psychrobacter sp. W2-37-MNA-CIBAN-0211 TaxID=3140443 RepID=UPI003325EBEA